MLRKITAHLAIIFGGMCFVLFVIDAIKGGAMSFINNDMTKAFIAILSLLTIFNSVISLAGQTNEQRMAARFTDRYDTLICRELLVRNGVEAKSTPSERTPEYYKTRPCVRYVEECAGILADELNNQ